MVYVVCCMCLLGCKGNCNCNREYYEFEFGDICKCIITPDGGGDCTYLISIDDEGIVETSLGEVPDYILSAILKDKELPRYSHKLIRHIVYGDRKFISKKKLKGVRLLIDEADKVEHVNAYAESSYNDGRMVILLTEHQQFIFQYYDKEVDKELINLTNRLIELSPIPVDLVNHSCKGITIDEDSDAIREYDYYNRIDTVPDD